MIFVSVVITTKNEQKNIEKCLQSIKIQDLPQDKIEIIVIDNNSNDKTKEIAGKYTKKVYDFGPERSAQRNFGVKQASGEYILYLDADMILSKNVLSECVSKSKNEDRTAFYIPEKIVSSSLDNNYWIAVRNFERAFYNATVIDCVRFVRRDTFLKIGGFDESLTGPEDWDFDRRVKQEGRVDITKSVLYHNESSFSFKRYLKKKRYYSRDLSLYINKWGKKDKIVQKQFGFCYRYFGVFFEKIKWSNYYGILFWLWACIC